jgi:hypothetical protein
MVNSGENAKRQRKYRILPRDSEEAVVARLSQYRRAIVMCPQAASKSVEDSGARLTESVRVTAPVFTVMAGPAEGRVPAIHDLPFCNAAKTWIPATSAGMTVLRGRPRAVIFVR